MESTAIMLPNGSIGSWQTPDGTDIFFPSQVVLDGE